MILKPSPQVVGKRRYFNNTGVCYSQDREPCHTFAVHNWDDAWPLVGTHNMLVPFPFLTSRIQHSEKTQIYPGNREDSVCFLLFHSINYLIWNILLCKYSKTLIFSFFLICPFSEFCLKKKIQVSNSLGIILPNWIPLFCWLLLSNCYWVKIVWIIFLSTFTNHFICNIPVQ